MLYVLLSTILVSLSALLMIRHTKHAPSKEVVMQIHSLVDSMIAQAKLLEKNILALQEDVGILEQQVEILKTRSDDLSTQITEVRNAIKG